MVCNCRTCIENEDGYCSCSSYVTISESGYCETATIVSTVDIDREEKE